MVEIESLVETFSLSCLLGVLVVKSSVLSMIVDIGCVVDESNVSILSVGTL